MEQEEKVEVVQRKDRGRCMTANGFLICYCGKCEPEDYKLPSDFNPLLGELKIKNMKQIMQQSKKYRLDKIKEIEMSNNNWLTVAYKIKSMSIIKVGLILAGIVAFIIFNYWLNEMLLIRDMQLFLNY